MEEATDVYTDTAERRTLADFLTDVHASNEWVIHGKTAAYLRLTDRVIEGERCPVIDVANVEVFAGFRDRGEFRRLIDYIAVMASGISYVRVENVMVPWLREHLVRRGFKREPAPPGGMEGFPSYYVRPQNLLNIRPQ